MSKSVPAIAQRTLCAGLSLIFVSILLTIASIIIISVLPGQEAGDINKKISASTTKLERVEEAMRSFMAANGRRPCPADGNKPLGDSNFGIEAATPGTCTVTSGMMGPDTGTGYIVGGTIPTNSLHLPDEYAFDDFGRRFTYVVDTRATQTSSCLTTHTGGIQIQDKTTGGTVLDTTMYAYISHGLSGHGAFPAKGSATTARLNTGTTDQDENTNAGASNDGNMTYSTGNFKNYFIQKAKSPTFDDMVWYRPDLKNTCCLGKAACTVASSGGSITNGVSNGDSDGWSVAVGDVNGDGIADLIIGAYGANSGAGRVYVVFGSSTGIANPLALSALNGSNGFELDGAAGNTGWSVAAGDVNGDGKADIIIGAPLSTVGATSNAGKVFVVFGGATKAGNGAGTAWTSCPCTLNAAYLNGTNGAEFDGPTTNGGHAGNSVTVGDVNGDGKADILIGANRATIGGNASAGAVYVVFGKAGAWSGTATSLVAAFLNGTNGAEFDGYTAGDWAGYSLAAGNVKGSVNGANPISDIIIGEPMHSNGMVTVVFGKAAGWSGTASLLSSSCSGHGCTPFLNGTNGVEFDGTAGNPGWSVAAGDVNGDGKADIIIGAPSGGSLSAGAVYVVFGKSAGWSGTATSINAAFLNGTNGAEFDGGAASYGAGGSVAVGDVNHDGIPDLIIGEPGTTSNTGAAAVVFGHSAGWSGTATTLNAAFLNGTNGIQLNGANNGDQTGSSVAAGDFNGDGINDIAIGAFWAPYSGSAGPGKVYIYNGKSSGWTTPVNLGGL